VTGYPAAVSAAAVALRLNNVSGSLGIIPNTIVCAQWRAVAMAPHCQQNKFAVKVAALRRFKSGDFPSDL
jgi:hypothetical protein